jgi:hypothetical protein
LRDAFGLWQDKMGANFGIGAGKPASEGDVEVDSMIIAGVVAVVGVKEPLFDFSRAGVIGVPIETISLLEREEGTGGRNGRKEREEGTGGSRTLKIDWLL